MITGDDVDAIIQDCLEEQCGPLVNPLDEGENQEDPPTDQGGNNGGGGDVKNGQGNEGGNGKDNQSQGGKDDDSGDGGSDRGDGEQTPIDEDIRNRQKE